MREQEILDAGYHSYEPHAVVGKGADRAYSKWFYAPAGGREYCIHISVYDHLPSLNNTTRIGFMADTQFNTETGDTFNTELLINDDSDTIEKVEVFFKTLFVAMCCRPYGS